MGFQHKLLNEYLGYRYEPWAEDDGDTCKTEHRVIGPNGEHLKLPLSPYARATARFFKLWVEAGCPYPKTQRLTLEELEDIIADKILLKD
jgi:hypothetical protein